MNLSIEHTTLLEGIPSSAARGYTLSSEAKLSSAMSPLQLLYKANVSGVFSPYSKKRENLVYDIMNGQHV